MAYDLVVIGGGIVGAGIARDAALRGLKVALFEREDFASGTTSRSTRLIHGGLRYLAQYDFALVREALTERRALLRNAPHLVRPLPFLLPVYRGHGHAVPILWTGITLYDYLDPRRTVPHHRFLPRSTALRLEPTLGPKGLRGAFLYYDSQCAFPERLCLENALDAVDHGAHVQNHAAVVGLDIQGGQVTGVRVRDELSGRQRRVATGLVVNCTGPWLDEVERLGDANAAPQLRRTKGVHLVMRRFTQNAIVFETRDADRVVFAIPWGDHELVGTTDTDYEGRSEDVRCDAADRDYLLAELNAVTQRGFGPQDVLFTTAGLRPLPRQEDRATAAITRRHGILDHEKTDGVRGWVTVVGGKITTFRHTAQDVVDYLVDAADLPAGPCRTMDLPLPGGRIGTSWRPFLQRVLEEARRQGLDAEVGRHLADHYGVQALTILGRAAADPRLAERIEPEGPWIWAQVEHAVVRERALTLADVMLRRLAIGLSQGQGRRAAPRVAAYMGQRLAWSPARTEDEARQYEAALERNWTANP